MRSIARKRDAAPAIGRDDALMHAIGALLNHIIGLGLWHDDLQAFFDELFGELFFNWQIFARIDRHAPAAGHFQQAEIAAFLPAISDIGEALQMFLKGKERGDEERCLWIGLAIKGQFDGLANKTA